MRVVYVNIDKQIRDAVYAADATNRLIDHIELTRQEAAELARYVYKYLTPEGLPAVNSGDYYYGARLEIKE